MLLPLRFPHPWSVNSVPGSCLSCLVMAVSWLFIGDTIPLSGLCSPPQVTGVQGENWRAPRHHKIPKTHPKHWALSCAHTRAANVSQLTTWHCLQCHSLTSQLSTFVPSPCSLPSVQVSTQATTSAGPSEDEVCPSPAIFSLNSSGTE